MPTNTLPATGTVGDEQTISGVTYILTGVNPPRWKPKGGVTLNTTVNNTYQEVTFTATVVDDSSSTGNLSVISKNNDTLTVATSDAGNLTGDFHTTQRAREAVTGATIDLAVASSVNNSPIITQALVDAAVGTGDFVIVDNVLQVNNGITSPGFASFVRVNGFLGVRQESSDDTRDVFIVTYRGATHTVYFFKTDNTWRSSDSTTDNTNIITPLIGG